MGCPDENVLAEYVDNVLDAGERRRVEQHLDTCTACRMIVSDLGRMQHAAGDERTVADAALFDGDTTTATHGTFDKTLEHSLRGVSTVHAVRHRKRTSHIVPGTMIGEYEVTRVLGAGGMGIVFGAIHPRIGKRAAIKILQRELASDETAIVRFENEARAVNAIGHPNIVDIFAFGELPNGDPYYVMEHVDGKSLHEWIYGHGQLSLARSMPVLRQICDALSAAHQRGIIHRDLKPGNIMIAGSDDAPRVKVLDFGLAKMARDGYNDDLTNPGIALGTPAFMSPEQFMGKDVDQRTDVYALGVLIYQMLTGAYPFSGDTPSAIGNQHLFHTPRLPSKMADLPARMDQIIEKALAKDAGSRYATVAELRRDLEQCASEMPTPRASAVIASPKALPEAPTMKPAVAAPGAPTMVQAAAIVPPSPPTPDENAPTLTSAKHARPVSNMTAPVRRGPSRRIPLLVTAGVALVVVAMLAIFAGRPDATKPAPAPEPEQKPSVPTPVITEKPVESSAPVTPTPVVEDTSAPTTPEQATSTTPANQATPTKKPLRRAAKQTTTSRVTKPKTTTTSKGSAAADDDRMLLEGGSVKSTH
ncbi:MAG TPA: protein kinase [Kofleriaceae bacterium]|nr:protein kinase [Kofleriaceae bacterium]